MNTKNLLKNPANGGIPANEKRASVMTIVSLGWSYKVRYNLRALFYRGYVAQWY